MCLGPPSRPRARLLAPLTTALLRAAQAQLMLDVYAEVLNERELPHLAVVDFSWFPPECVKCGGVESGGWVARACNGHVTSRASGSCNGDVTSRAAGGGYCRRRFPALGRLLRVAF